MSLKVDSAIVVCPRCGQGYSKRRGYFYASSASCHKGISFIPICKTCVDKMYQGYLSTCNDSRKAVRQMCRKLDLYWNEKLFTSCEKMTVDRTVMTSYIMRVNNAAYAGRSYDDTLLEEDMLWQFKMPEQVIQEPEEQIPKDEDPCEEVPNEVVEFWGTGYTPSMYKELQARYDFYLSRFPAGSTLDVGGEILLRQICNLEIDINRDRAAGKAVDKNINALNTLLGSAMLKPVQKKEDADTSATNTPYGVWIWRFENEEPIPDPDPQFKDVDNIVRYITTWFYGHTCKMVGVKNFFSSLYDKAISKLRVKRPELRDADDEEVFESVFAEDLLGDDDE